MHGLHVLQSPDPPCSDAGAASAVAVHVDGFVSPASLVNVSCDTDAGGWLDEVTSGVSAAVAQTRPLHRQLLSETGALSDAALRERAERLGHADHRFAYFTPHGTQLETAAELIRALTECHTVYGIEGGAFMWPGIRVGYNRALDGNVTMTTRSLAPLAFTIEPLFTEAEAAAIVAEAEPKLERSRIESGSDRGGSVSQGRTSTQTTLGNGPARPSASTAEIEQRAARLLRTTINNGESLSVVSYKPGQRYNTHMDYFDVGQNGRMAPEVARVTANGDRNRLATLVWTLQAPMAGGETHLPMSGTEPSSLDTPLDMNDDFYKEAFYSMCTNTKGVSVKPRVGRSTFFYNLRPDGAVDPFSIHTGCPPTGSDSKVAANKWFWSKPTW